MAIEKMTIPGTDTAIWGEPVNINFFLNTDLVPDTVAGRTVSNQTVRSHTRRQYPGDTTAINVSSHQRQMLVDPGRRSGNALPGSSFRVVSDAGLPAEENRQFTVQGRWEDVVDLFAGDAAMLVQLYSPRGTRYVVDGTTP